MMRAVFLDRDGVINEDRDDYVKNVRELRVFPFAPDAVRRINEAGYAVVVVSNQQGVAKGLISEDDLRAMQDEINRRVESAGGRISAFYYCKHLASQGCECRKPQPGMLLTAAKDLGIDLSQSVMIGDTERDMLAGKSAGCGTILVLTGGLTAENAESMPCTPDFVADDLSKAADHLARLDDSHQA